MKDQLFSTPLWTESQFMSNEKISSMKEKIIRETGIEKKRLEGWFFRARKRMKKQQETAKQANLPPPSSSAPLMLNSGIIVPPQPPTQAAHCSIHSDGFQSQDLRQPRDNSNQVLGPYPPSTPELGYATPILQQPPTKPAAPAAEI